MKFSNFTCQNQLTTSTSMILNQGSMEPFQGFDKRNLKHD